ncbi:uncharacterized protein N7458_002527 [Penicillium daleae]|uniref:FAD-binding FR-type domain-containing protein n=1 Tax=Penicillium daleae TaxID=63821 RepID=A0AAD6G6V1_9EURO|nr:uncharacterized protein N7458_002527 [Penicillium daleae]KAJ5460975.1 hypothetical protein N7458_002527 [Penicillium daleae]
MHKTASRLLAWLSNLSAPELYSISAACVLIVWLIYWLGRDVGRWGWRRCHGALWLASTSQQPSAWRRLLFVSLPRTLQWIDISTYLQALTVALLLAANLVGIGFRTHSWAEAQKRAGALAVVHFLPLCTGITFGLPADLLHMNRQTFAWLHRWFGRLCTLQSLLHGSAIVSIAQTSTLATFVYIVPLVAGCSLFLVMLMTLQAIRQRHPQVVMKCHYALAVIAIGALVYHLAERHSLYRWYLLGAICLWLLASFTVCLLTVLAYKPWQKSTYEITMNAPNRLLWLDITVPVGWNMRPGQYVQVWLPRSGTRARLQLLLFYVAVWEEDEVDSRGRIHMVAQPRSGLTTKLYQTALHRAVLARNMAEQADSDRKVLDPQSLDPTLRQPAVVLGPYGCADDFSRFGTVLFIVEEVGFFRVLSYVGMLVEASRKRQAMVRKLEIIWQGGVFDYPRWLVLWFQRMFDLDKEGFNVSTPAAEIACCAISVLTVARYSKFTSIAHKRAQMAAQSALSTLAIAFAIMKDQQT